MGGGSLMTPILILIFGFKPTVAVGTDIVHGAIFKSFGAWRHRQLGTVNMRLAGWMLVGSAPFSLLGVALATWIEHHYGARAQTIESKILGIALILGGIGFFVKTFVRGKENSYAPFPVETNDKLIAIGIGVFGGFIVGLTSVGSGTFFGLAMLILFPLSAARVVGTDIFQAAALLWVAGVGHMIAGNVDFHATGWLLIGSIPGVLIGSNVSVRLPDRALRVALATTLTLSGVRLLDVPFAQYYIPITLAFVGVGVLWSWAKSRQSAAAAGTGGSGQDTKGLPVSQQPSLYASQPVQNPVVAASSASAATIEPSTSPTVERPTA
jgi:uncharacterized protein